MKKSGIYRIFNKISGKEYIGSSCDLDKRLYEHKRRLRKGNHHNRKLQRAFNKYSESAFGFEVILEIIEPHDLLKYEQELMDKRKPEYNIVLIAGGNFNLGRSFSKKWRENISKGKKGKLLGAMHTKEFKEKMRDSHIGDKNPMFGKGHSADSIEKIRQSSISRKNSPKTIAALKLGHGWNKGIPFSKESREKMSISAKNRWKSCR